MDVLGYAEEPRHLAGDDVKTDARQIAADHRIRHVYDQLPQAQRAEDDLQQSRCQPEQREQQHRCGEIAAVHHELQRKSSQYRRRRRTGRGDQSFGATQCRRDQPERHCAKDAGQRALRHMRGTER
jgi:hypothetical protein